MVNVHESPKPHGPDIVAGIGCMALSLVWSVFFDDFVTRPCSNCWGGSTTSVMKNQRSFPVCLKH